MDLEKIKNVFTNYEYPWINPINGKQFHSRNLLLTNLKKYLTKNEYKYVYPYKYVYITNFKLDAILSNMDIDINNKKILSPVDKKWYDYNKIFSHLACFFDNDSKRIIIYNLFLTKNLIPNCSFSGKKLGINDLIKPRTSTTPHPLNSLFNKYSYTLTKEDYSEIHKRILLSHKVISKRKEEWEKMKNDIERNKEWRKNLKIARKDMDYSWLKSLTEEEKSIRRKKSSESQKRNILEGKFTPQNNYRTKRRIEINFNNKEYYFRSSWEVCFFISNSYLEYESIRIPYIKNKESKIYIPDFIDINKKIIYELKPKRQYLAQTEKMNAAINWCLKNEYKFIWVNEFNLIYFINKEICMSEDFSLLYNKMIKGIKSE